ncbi:MAG TPA: hypothetical protein VLF60_00265 [Candidatus Saccharimonadales bacterium]|nr:hypothetical protein [Candidatus Saccharimonadales bacterium]
MNKQIDELLQQKMDRKNFLKNVALSVVMMTGAASLIKTFNQTGSHQKHGSSHSMANGAYGSMAYGGAAKTRSIR